MDLYRRLLTQKILQNNRYFLVIKNIAYSTTTKTANKTPNATPETPGPPKPVTLIPPSEAFEPYPYTSGLFRKNYIRYVKQSIPVVSHDYVYTGSERLPGLEERLKEFEDPLDKSSTVNIGYDYKKDVEGKIAAAKEQAAEQFKQNKLNDELGDKARNLKLEAPLDQVNKDWKQYAHFAETRQIAEHYNIYKDLYDSGYFYPCVDLPISYKNAKGEAVHVQYGNKIEAQDTSAKPEINLDTLDPNKYYTLTFLNLDGNLKESSNEVLLWFVGNMSKTSKGDELLRYIQPFPMRGTGWHRCVYVLYEHDKKIDFTSDVTKKTQFEVDNRSFKTFDFLVKHQEAITPVSLAFFQTQWDLSVKRVFHEILNIKEPVYEYDFGKRFIPQQEKYPKKQVFNWYLEDYQDKKDINEYVMKKYMKDLSPFEDYPKELEYPVLESPISPRLKVNYPRWYNYELRHYRLREHKWSHIPFKNTAKAWQLMNRKFSLPYGYNRKINRLLTTKTDAKAASVAVIKDEKTKPKESQKQNKKK